MNPVISVNGTLNLSRTPSNKFANVYCSSAHASSASLSLEKNIEVLSKSVSLGANLHVESEVNNLLQIQPTSSAFTNTIFRIYWLFNGSSYA